MPFAPRSVNPIDVRPLSPEPSDIDFVDSDGEKGTEERAAKQLRREMFAHQYLLGRQLFILSAGLKGPFDNGWQNPWKGTKTKRIERSFVDETPNIEAGRQRKRRRTDGDALSANNDLHKAIRYSSINHQRLTEEHNIAGTIRKGAKRTISSKPSTRVNVSPQPNLKKGSEEGSSNQSSRLPEENRPRSADPGDRRSGTPTAAWLKTRNTVNASVLASKKETTPTPGTRVQSRKATANTATEEHDNPDNLKPTIDEIPTVVGVPEGPVVTGFMPINKPNGHHFFEQPSPSERKSEAGISDETVTPVKKKPRLVDFAAMSTPRRGRGVTKNHLPSKADENAPDAVRTSSEEMDRERSTNIGTVENTGETEPVATEVVTPLKAKHDQSEVVPEKAVVEVEDPKPTKATLTAQTEDTAKAQDDDLHNEEQQAVDHQVIADIEKLTVPKAFTDAVSEHGQEPSRLKSPTSDDPVLFQSNTGSENNAPELHTSEDELPKIKPFGSFGISRLQIVSQEEPDSQESPALNTQQLLDTATHISPVTVKKAPRPAIVSKRASFALSPSEENRSISFAPDNGIPIFRKSPDMETSPEQSPKDVTSPPFKEAGQEKAPIRSALKSSLVASRSGTGANGSFAFGAMTPEANFGGRSESDDELDGYLDHLGDYMQGWDLDTEMKRVMAANKLSSATSASSKPEKSLRRGLLGRL